MNSNSSTSDPAASTQCSGGDGNDSIVFDCCCYCCDFTVCGCGGNADTSVGRSASDADCAAAGSPLL